MLSKKTKSFLSLGCFCGILGVGFVIANVFLFQVGDVVEENIVEYVKSVKRVWVPLADADPGGDNSGFMVCQDGLVTGNQVVTVYSPTLYEDVPAVLSVRAGLGWDDDRRWLLNAKDGSPAGIRSSSVSLGLETEFLTILHFRPES